MFVESFPNGVLSSCVGENVHMYIRVVCVCVCVCACAWVCVCVRVYMQPFKSNVMLKTAIIMFLFDISNYAF